MNRCGFQRPDGPLTASRQHGIECAVWGIRCRRVAAIVRIASFPPAVRRGPSPASRGLSWRARFRCKVSAVSVCPDCVAPGRRPGRHPGHCRRRACASKPGERTQCAADTSAGVVLLRSTGDAPCLLGRTWGYDQTSVWVSDGCSAEFGTGPAAEPRDEEAQAPLAHSQRRVPALRRREGPDLFPAFQLRAVSEPAEPGRVLRRRLRQHEDR